MVLSVGYDINGFAWDVNSYLMQVGTSPTQPLEQSERIGYRRSGLRYVFLSVLPTVLASARATCISTWPCSLSVIMPMCPRAYVRVEQADRPPHAHRQRAHHQARDREVRPSAHMHHTPLSLLRFRMPWGT